MGQFGYLCVKCEEAIREGERGVFKHIRGGKVLGETRGTYDSYGRVEEDKEFRRRPDGINGEDEIMNSESIYPDSPLYDAKLYKGNPLTWVAYRKMKLEEGEGEGDSLEKMHTEWRDLPYAPKIVPPRSGIEAWHEYCYDRGRNTKELKNEHRISESDPQASYGRPRKKYR